MLEHSGPGGNGDSFGHMLSLPHCR